MIRTEKSIETLTKELAALDSAELHDLFTFYYRINHQYANLTSPDNFAKFLVSFDKNPFRRHEDKEFRKQMTDKGVVTICQPEYCKREQFASRLIGIAA